MGIFDAFETVLDRAAGAAQGFVLSGLNPIGAFTGAVAVENRKKQEKQIERAEFMALQNMGSPLDNFAGSSSTIAQPGFFSPGGALRSGLRDFGGLLGDFAPVASVFGLGNRFSNMPAAGAQTINFTPPAETSSSGEILGANLGLGTALIQGARTLSRSPGGQAAFGLGAGALGLALSGDRSGAPRVTRKMKSDVRRIYMMAGMDPALTAQILNNMGTYPKMDFNAALVFFILTKRFRNDGPVVTKAAVRKTKTTLRRMKGVVDMYNMVCKPTAPRRRAAPSRAKAVQLISNK